MGPTNRFEYMSRDHCACGAGLAQCEHDRVIGNAWGNVRFVQCDDCRSWVQSPQLTLPSLSAWYDSDAYQGNSAGIGSTYLDYEAGEETRRTEARGRFTRELCRDLLAPSRILEVGCATGSLLSVLQQAGHKVFGLDLSARFVHIARTIYGLDVHRTDLLDCPYEMGSFDLVIAMGTFSNLQRPGEHLCKIHALLKPTGRVYFNFPFADSWISRIYGRRYWMYAPSVNTFYSRKGCRKALEAAGFRVQTMCYDRQQPSWDKVVGHAQLRWLYPISLKLGLSQRALPVPLPVPGVKVCWGTKL